eukprot:1366317-Amorphochlora_amoeboformis.AAC.1
MLAEARAWLRSKWDTVFLAVLLTTLTMYTTLTLFEITRTELNYDDECLRVPIIPWVSSVIIISGPCVQLLLLFEWKLYNRLVDVEWKRIYWLSFIAAFSLDIVGYVATSRLWALSSGYLIVFGIDGRAINASKFRSLLYAYASFCVIVAYTSVSRNVYICGKDDFLLKALTSTRVSLWSYALLKNLEYAYVKYQYPHVQVTSNLDKMARIGFSSCKPDGKSIAPPIIESPRVEFKSTKIADNIGISGLIAKGQSPHPSSLLDSSLPHT